MHKQSLQKKNHNHYPTCKVKGGVLFETYTETTTKYIKQRQPGGADHLLQTRLLCSCSKQLKLLYQHNTNVRTSEFNNFANNSSINDACKRSLSQTTNKQV